MNSSQQQSSYGRNNIITILPVVMNVGSGKLTVVLDIRSNASFIAQRATPKVTVVSNRGKSITQLQSLSGRENRHLNELSIELCGQTLDVLQVPQIGQIPCYSLNIEVGSQGKMIKASNSVVNTPTDIDILLSGAHMWKFV